MMLLKNYRGARQWWVLGTGLWLSAIAASGSPPAIKLEVDATDSPRKLLHSRLEFPAQPGAMTLLYPKWIPGEHGPTGPITDLVGLRLTAAGKPVPWQRDAEDMFAFHLTAPADAQTVVATFDFLLPPNSGGFSAGASSTPQLLDLSWNQVLLYPKGAKAAAVTVAPTLRLPRGWKYGTALRLETESGGMLRFQPVTLEKLVDSPLIAGTHFRTLDLSPRATPRHFLHLAGDSAEALQINPQDTGHFTRLVEQTGALFGARHYRDYHFLVTLSDHVAHFGLEHHESSDNRLPERYLTDDDTRNLSGYLLPHEMVHSWNGKYRRPAGMVTPDFQQPIKSELLWIYEGLTDYYGIVLAARSGLWNFQTFREYLALEAAALDRAQGRQWRPLADTTVAAQLLYQARSEGTARRRGTDFYEEGDLIWLEADVLIRQQTRGRRSLDDFCKEFFGGTSGPPTVVAYTLADVLSVLDAVAPFDWRGFFDARVYAANPRAPLGGIEAAGWRLVYTNTLPGLLKSREAADRDTDLRHSLGLVVKEDGQITDVLPGSPADQAGVGPAMKLLAVNGRRWTPEILRGALRAAASGTAPVELLVENEEFFQTCRLDYHGGEKYPRLERDASKPDLLKNILTPLAP